MYKIDDREGFADVPGIQRFDTCHVDADSILHKVANVVQKGYINVMHNKSGVVKEFRNVTEFYGRGNKRDKGWLGDLNKIRTDRGQATFALADFTIRKEARIKPYKEWWVEGDDGEKVKHWEGFKSEEDALNSAISHFGVKVGRIKEAMEAKRYKLYIGGKGNYRKDIASRMQYKGSRPPKPIIFNTLEAAIKEQYDSHLVVCDGQEAEDAVSIEMRKNYLKYKETGKWQDCFMAIDKDLHMIKSPRKSYDSLETPYVIPSELECFKCFMSQCLTGDSTDDIPGLPDLSKEFREKHKLAKRKGIGPKTAESLLAGCESRKEMLQIVVDAYQSHYGTDYHTFTSWRGEELAYCWSDFLTETSILLWMREEEGEVFDVMKLVKELGVEV